MTTQWQAAGLFVQEMSGVALMLLSLFSGHWLAFGVGTVFIIGARLAHIANRLGKP